jgi:hypothetical protein
MNRTPDQKKISRPLEQHFALIALQLSKPKKGKSRVLIGMRAMRFAHDNVDALLVGG